MPPNKKEPHKVARWFRKIDNWLSIKHRVFYISLIFIVIALICTVINVYKLLHQ